MGLVHIVAAKPLGAHVVELSLSNGQVIRRDLEPLLKGPVFAQLRASQSSFEEFHVEGGALVWPGGADLCPDVLIWGGLPPADASSSAA